jgi:RHS repeat-associated protein
MAGQTTADFGRHMRLRIHFHVRLFQALAAQRAVQPSPSQGYPGLAPPHQPKLTSQNKAAFLPSLRQKGHPSERTAVRGLRFEAGCHRDRKPISQTPPSKARLVHNAIFISWFLHLATGFLSAPLNRFLPRQVISLAHWRSKICWLRLLIAVSASSYGALAHAVYQLQPGKYYFVLGTPYQGATPAAACAAWQQGAGSNYVMTLVNGKCHVTFAETGGTYGDFDVGANCTGVPNLIGQKNVGNTAYCLVSSCQVGQTNCVDPKNVGPSECSAGTTPTTSHPIRIANGNKFLVEPDMANAVEGTPRFVRYYHSGPSSVAQIQSGLGRAWLHTYSSFIFYDSSLSQTTAYRYDGKVVAFTWQSGAWTSDADITDRLVQLKDSTGATTGWQYRVGKTGAMETYGPSGKLMSIQSPAGVTQSLIYSDGTNGTVSGQGGYALDAAGNPTTFVLPAGLLLRVTDTFGHTLSFGYDRSSHIVKLTDPVGGVYRYAYDESTSVVLSGHVPGNNLTSITYPDGSRRLYWYNEQDKTANTDLAHALTGITDENGVRYATYSYASNGRAISETLAGGVDSASLSFGSNSTVVTDPLGTQRTYNFQNTLGVYRSTNTSQPAGSGCGPASRAMSYDANGNVASVTDFNGNVSCHAYDLSRNLETARIEGVAPGGSCPADVTASTPAFGTEERKITTAWHPDWRLEVQRAEPRKLTTWVYNGQPDPTNGNAVASCAPSTALLPDGKPIAVLCKKVEQATADAAGAQGLFATVTGTPRIWTYTYNSFGQVTSVDGPRTDVSDVATLTYDTSGNLTSITNALGQVTTFGQYDAHGRVGRITDPNGVITDLTYDARGRLTSRTVDGKTTTFQYDGVGQLTKVMPPNGAFLQYTYSAAHRLTDVTDALGNKIHTTYDLAGNKTQEEVFDPSNTLVRQQQWVYDTLSRLHQSIGAAGQTTTFGYDANGNRTSITDPLGRVTTYAYDALNRVVAETDPLAGSTGYSYDALDHLLAVTDPANLTTTYTYNGFGDRLQETSPNTGTTTYTYDSAGNRMTRTDANGITATSSYDALNRLTGIKYPGTASDVTYTYDQGTYGLGRLTQLGDSQTSTDFAYSPTGAVLSQTLKETASGLTQGTIAYQYDAADLITRITYNALHQVNYARAVNGQVQTITKTTGGGPVETLASDIQYQPFGPLQSLTYGNGLVWTRSFDLDGRLTGQTTGTLQSLAYAYDPVGNLTGLTDGLNSANNQTFGYDALDRLVSASGAYGTLTYTYDATGNRQSEIHDANTTDYQYLLTDQRLQAQTGAVNKTYAYDAAGHTLQAGSTEFVYGANGRLNQAKQGPTVLADYGYDALGRRVTKTVTGQIRYFSFDLDGKLLADENAYVYLDDLPLVQLDSLGNPSYLHPNHLGAPLKATNETGTVVWAADSEPFGKTSLVNPSVSVNLRLPGQYYDAETGLHYNYFRDYDPSLGRYLESDPIGLKGGINTYAYVGNNPINWVDPLGLESAKYNVPTPPFVFPPGSPEYNATAKALDGLSDAMHDAVDSIYNAKPPKNAYNPNGPKAPGKPRPENGFEDPKDGENWVPNPYPGKGGSSHGWQDSKGRVWCPTGQGGRAHGGRHWDVQLPGGRNINVRPEDNINDLL